MKNLNSHTGYLIIDHSESPGINENDVPQRLRSSTSIVKEGEIFERDTKNCSHCERLIILEPKRVRERARCHYCNHYICDECDRMLRVTGQCIPFKKVVDRAQELVERGEPLIIIDN